MTQNPSPSTATLLVGVEPDQSPTVLNAVAPLAAQLQARVVCVHVHTGRFITQRLPENLAEASPAISGSAHPDEQEVPFPQGLRDHLAEVFDPLQVSWEAREVEGDPAKALAQLAEELDANMIVVGTRRKGWRNRMEQFIDGSIAVSLSHRQGRPVLVVPQVANESGRRPWEG